MKSAGKVSRVKPVILASGSAIRRQLLASSGVMFSVVPADIDEGDIRARSLNESDCVDGPHLAGVLARAKAEAVSQLHPGALVIGADQVLSLGSRLFEKPVGLVEARETLERLRGRTHDLHSAVVIAEAGVASWGTCESASLTMRPFSKSCLEAYIARAGERICASVGAYELEGLGLQLFERVEGDYFTILGLPMLSLLAQLRVRGVVLT
jgi:septum formation protein